VAADPQVSGIVIGGEGKAFVVGADIGFFLRNVESKEFGRIAQFTQAGHNLMNTIDRCPKPVVARVGGAALGAGTELALACDRVVASPRASLGFPETGLGIYPGFGGTQRTPRAVGIGLAKWLLFTGKTLSAAEAWTIGLVDRVVPHEELDDAARRCAGGILGPEKPGPRPPKIDALERFFESYGADQLLAGTADTGGDRLLARAMRRVAAGAPIALRYAERMIQEGAGRSLEAGLQMEIDHAAEIFSTKDAHTGLSFRVNRQFGQPTFEGC